MKKLFLLAMVILLIAGCATTKPVSVQGSVHTINTTPPENGPDGSFVSRFFKWFGERLDAEWKEFLDIVLDPDLNAKQPE